MPLTVGNFLAGPLIAFVVIGVLAAILRWTFGRSGGYGVDPRLLKPTFDWPAVEPPPAADATRAHDYGLLQAVATLTGPERAAAVRDKLVLAGIRATVAAGPDGRYRVLVFDTEAGRAKRLVDS